MYHKGLWYRIDQRGKGQDGGYTWEGRGGENVNIHILLLVGFDLLGVGVAFRRVVELEVGAVAVLEMGVISLLEVGVPSELETGVVSVGVVSELNNGSRSWIEGEGEGGGVPDRREVEGQSVAQGTRYKPSSSLVQRKACHTLDVHSTSWLPTVHPGYSQYILVHIPSPQCMAKPCYIRS